jgi:hypothetical protein
MWEMSKLGWLIGWSIRQVGGFLVFHVCGVCSICKTFASLQHILLPSSYACWANFLIIVIRLFVIDISLIYPFSLLFVNISYLAVLFCPKLHFSPSLRDLKFRLLLGFSAVPHVISPPFLWPCFLPPNGLRSYQVPALRLSLCYLVSLHGVS